MGVPKFFRWISERYPCLSEIVKEYQLPAFDNLYLDMNGIIHICSHPNDFDPHFRITEENIFKDIFHYIEVLFRIIKPQKVFFMAVDGVAPRAKMNQQRGRRFRSAKDAETLENKAKEKGESLPSEARFDSNCITPGTEFMARLHEQLKYFVTYKISTDPLWQKCKVIFSGHETPGEGEHKIMDYIRYSKSQPDYDPNTRHCLYGLDADLMMLGLCSHEPHFSLLREEVKYSKQNQKRTVTPEEQTFLLLHLSLLREYLEMEFQPLKDDLSFPFDMEKIIDDWVLMGFLVGNDFIPPLPDMHIATGALPILYEAYMQVMPTLGGYINEAGTLHLERFQKYMEKLSSFDIDQFRETYADLKFCDRIKESQEQSKADLLKTVVSMLNKDDENSSEIADGKVLEEDKTKEMQKETAKVNADESGCRVDNLSEENAKLSEEVIKFECSGRKVNRELEALIKETEDMFLNEPSVCDDFDDMVEEDEEDEKDEDEEDENNFYSEFYQHKRDYYINKLEYSIVDEEVLRSQAEGYVRAIQWNLNYYYNGVCSWSWFYPHHYAPYVSDIHNFSDLKLEFDMGKPFLPFEQLLAVLPAASKKLLPEPYQSLMVNTKSPIINYYPSQFKTDLNGKKQEWEAVVLIPFIDEHVLLNAMEPINKLLTPEEQKRNSHGPALVYEYTKDDLGHYEAPNYFPSLPHNHAKVVELYREDIHVNPSKLVKGLCSGAELDVYFPGFPTFKHLKYSASLQKRKVKVFEMPSRGDNMIIEIKNESKPDVKEVAKELIGKSVFVNWPHLTEVKVIAVVSSTIGYSIPQELSNVSSGMPEIVEEEVKEKLATVWKEKRYEVQDRYMNRLGIDIGNTDILLQGLPIIGHQYGFGKQGLITLDKKWAKTASSYAFQATVKNISLHDDASCSKQLSLEEVFPVGAHVVLLGHPHYGYMGEVKDYEDGTQRSGRLKITITVTQEPDFTSVREKHENYKMNYMPGSIAARRIGISAHLLSRITGTIFIVHGTGADGNESKTNIGLNLKFNRKNEEVPGYTMKDNGMWLYSHKAVEAVATYIKKFPKLFDYLSNNTGNDIFNDEDVFRDSKDSLSAISSWLKEQPFSYIGRRVWGSPTLEPDIVRELENTVDSFYQTKISMKAVTMQVKPHLLFKPSMQIGSLPPDPDATFMLLDRVVVVRESYTVPVGWKGTVTGIHQKESDADTIFDVVFDKRFVGGMSVNCSENRGYRVPRYALVNLSHGERLVQEKNVMPEKLDKKNLLSTSSMGKDLPPSNGVFSSVRSWSGSQIQQKLKQQAPSSSPNSTSIVVRPPNVVSSHPNSAFASWRNKGIIPPSNHQSFMRTPQTLPQAGPKIEKNWHQRPPIPGQIFQTQQNPRPFVQPMQQVPGQLQILLNKNSVPTTILSNNESKSEKPLQTKPIGAKPTAPNEFQLMLNELQGMTSKNPDLSRKSSQLSSSPHQPQVNDSGTEILKKMLRIPEAPTDKPQPISSTQQTMKQVSVQEIFEHARGNEPNKSLEESCTLQLLKLFQLQGTLPKYIYTENKEDSSVFAKVILPNMRSFTGAGAKTKELAGENAAKVALNQITSERNLFHGKMNNIGIGGARPLTNNLPSPPQKWCWPQNQQQQQPRQNWFQQPDQSKQDWRLRNDHNPYANHPSNTWRQQPPPAMIVPPPSHSPYVVQQQIRTPTRTNWRDEPRQSSRSFVPLQAVKQQRNKSGGHQQPQQQQPQQQQQQEQQQQQQQQTVQQKKPQQMQPSLKKRTQQNKTVPNQSQQPSEKSVGKSKDNIAPAEKSTKENVSNESKKNCMTPGTSKPKVGGSFKPQQKKSRIAANFGVMNTSKQLGGP